ncbi:hypothetical protein LCGC14_2864320 [marine sediment metagenome]|uniref:Uncharacterized protein n=1 Tax=marine sediment metagenome TaxID=412755 RepID=A0A0F8Y4Q6_9ZZZZ
MVKQWSENVNLVVERGLEKDKTTLEKPFIKIRINSINQIHLTDERALKLSKDIKDLLK